MYQIHDVQASFHFEMKIDHDKTSRQAINIILMRLEEKRVMKRKRDQEREREREREREMT